MALVRPILDYGATVWYHVLKKDIRAIENVQRRTTTLIRRIEDLSYID